MATIPAAAVTAFSGIYTGDIIPSDAPNPTGVNGVNRHDDQHERLADWVAAVHGMLGSLVETTDARLSNARTPTAHNHTGAEITSGTISVDRIGTGTKNENTYLAGDGTFKPVAATSPLPSSAVLWASSTGVWTNMPAAVTEIAGSMGGRIKVDLSLVSECRIITTVRTAGVVGATLALQYATDGNGQAAWADLTGSVTIDTTGGRAGNWTPVPAGAKADVWVRVVGAGGDGVADPAILLVALQSRGFTTAGGTSDFFVQS